MHKQNLISPTKIVVRAHKLEKRTNSFFFNTQQFIEVVDFMKNLQHDFIMLLIKLK